MATVNDVCLLAAILSDLCDDTDKTIYFTYFRYQNITANASQIIWILIQYLRHECRHFVNKLGVTWLKLLGSKFFRSQKKWERSCGNKPFSWGSFPKIRIDPRALVTKLTPVKYSQPLVWWSTRQDISPGPRFDLLIHTDRHAENNTNFRYCGW